MALGVQGADGGSGVELGVASGVEFVGLVCVAFVEDQVQNALFASDLVIDHAEGGGFACAGEGVDHQGRGGGADQV